MRRFGDVDGHQNRHSLCKKISVLVGVFCGVVCCKTNVGPGRLHSNSLVSEYLCGCTKRSNLEVCSAAFGQDCLRRRAGLCRWHPHHGSGRCLLDLSPLGKIRPARNIRYDCRLSKPAISSGPFLIVISLVNLAQLPLVYDMTLGLRDWTVLYLARPRRT